MKEDSHSRSKNSLSKDSVQAAKQLKDNYEDPGSHAVYIYQVDQIPNISQTQPSSKNINKDSDPKIKKQILLI